MTILIIEMARISAKLILKFANSKIESSSNHDESWIGSILTYCHFEKLWWNRHSYLENEDDIIIWVCFSRLSDLWD